MIQMKFPTIMPPKLPLYHSLIFLVHLKLLHYHLSSPPESTKLSQSDLPSLPETTKFHNLIFLLSLKLLNYHNLIFLLPLKLLHYHHLIFLQVKLQINCRSHHVICLHPVPCVRLNFRLYLLVLLLL